MLRHIVAVVCIEHDNNAIALDAYHTVFRLRIRLVVRHDVHRYPRKQELPHAARIWQMSEYTFTIQI